MAASWIAVGRAYVRSFRVSGIVGRVSSWRHYGALVSQSGEKITHTGQVYDDADYRKARFVGKQKEVNEQFAINLIAEQPVNESASRIVSCDGGGGALGHPKVYINLDKETKTGTCGYCGLQFKQQQHHH
ncbi:NADH dehydrogenase [ubiquinone] iron-sulfur protein 6, mitochondrial [Gastrophryne carolinensis]